MGVYALAVAVRLAFLAGARDHPLYQFLILDERSQHEVASAICGGTLPPNAPVKAPFYAYFLGTVYKIVGIDALRGRLVQVFVVSIAPVLVFAIGCRLFDQVVGILAGVLASVFWTLVFFSTELLDVSLASVFYLLLAWLLVAVDDRKWWKWFLAGGLIGLGAITRPNILAYAPVLAAIVVVAARRNAKASHAGDRATTHTRQTGWVRTAAARAGLLVVGTALAIAPVTLRNLILANERMLIAFFGGYNFYVANNPQSDGKNAVSPRLDVRVRHPGLDLEDPWVRWDEGFQAAYLYAAQHLGPRPSYDEAERFYMGLAMDYIRHHPKKLLTDTFKRLCWIFNTYEFPSNKDMNHLCRQHRLLGVLSWLPFGVIGPLGVVGLAMALGRRSRSLPLVYHIAMILSLALPGALFVVNARYRLPWVYLLMPLVAYAVAELVRRWAPPIQWRRVVPVTGALAALLVLSNVNWFAYRPPHHEYVLFSYAGACGAVGRDDLMDEVIEEIEQALADTSYRHMLHPWAMTCLFDYYCARGRSDRAAHYAEAILERDEPVDARKLAAVVEVLCQAGRREAAKVGAERMLARTGNQADPVVAKSLLTYGRAFRDRAALALAVRHYRALSRAAPGDDALTSALTQATESLRAMSGPGSSRPATSQP